MVRNSLFNLGCRSALGLLGCLQGSRSQSFRVDVFRYFEKSLELVDDFDSDSNQRRGDVGGKSVVG